MRGSRSRRALRLILLVSLVGLVGGGIAYAVIPDPVTDLIHGVLQEQRGQPARDRSGCELLRGG
jgi:hypothetical protein